MDVVGMDAEELKVFLQEAEEQIQLLDEDIVRLEKEADNSDLLQGIFRAAHTLKGSSRMLGFPTMAELTHAMKDALDKLRAGSLTVSPELVDALLESLDALKVLKAGLASGSGSEFDIAPMVDALRLVAQPAAATAAAAETTVSIEATVAANPAASERVEAASANGLNVHKIRITIDKESSWAAVRWHLEKVILPELLRHRSHLNIWAAGCSTGAEPYSLAILLDEQSSARDHRILATDIDANVLAQARAGGPFLPNEVQNVPKGLLQKYFTAEPRGYMIAETVRREVLFRKHNLLSDGFQIGFDLVLCRNVMIYFSDEAKAALFLRFHTALKPSGVLFIGGTEALLPGNSQGFEQLATNFYRKSGVAGVDAKRRKAA